MKMCASVPTFQLPLDAALDIIVLPFSLFRVAFPGAPAGCIDRQAVIGSSCMQEPHVTACTPYSGACAIS